MLPAQLFLFVFCIVQVIGVWSWTIPDLSGLTQVELLQKAKELDIVDLDEYKNKGYTVEEIVKLTILQKEKPNNPIEAVVQMCSALVSSNFTLDERDPIQNNTLVIFGALLKLFVFDESEEAQLIKNVFCSYLSHPSEDVKHAEALGLSMASYFKFKHIREKNTNQSVVEAAGELCNAFYTRDNLASLKLNADPIELSEVKLIEFKKLWNQVEHLDWDKSPRLVVQNLCDFLDVNVSSEEQAKALEITVDLYSSVLNGLRKQPLKDNSIQDSVDIYRQICKYINLSLGYSNLYVSQNGTLTDDQLNYFWLHTISVDFYKWKSIQNICVYLNETASIKYIAESAGLSQDQLAQRNSHIYGMSYMSYLSVMPIEDDYYVKSQISQTLDLCNAIHSVRETSISFLVFEKKLGEFVFKASQIFSSPLNNRLELLKGICLTTFPELYTIES